MEERQALNDWSGMITVDSLPHEYRAKESRNIRALQAALRTPSPQISESYRGQPAGFPAIVESLAGGSMQVSVNTLPRISQPAASYPDNLDRYDLKGYQRAKFTEFFANMVNGNIRVREGPKAGSVSGVGIPQWSGQWPNLDTDSPHGAAMARRRTSNRRRGYIDDGPLRREARIHDGSDCDDVHPYQTHADWASAEEEEEERLRAKTSERYLRAVITESHDPNCPLRRWAIRKLNR